MKHNNNLNPSSHARCDLQNAQDYKIDGNDCYYKNELIGEIKEKLKNGVLDIYFKPLERNAINQFQLVGLDGFLVQKMMYM